MEITQLIFHIKISTENVKSDKNESDRLGNPCIDERIMLSAISQKQIVTMCIGLNYGTVEAGHNLMVSVGTFYSLKAWRASGGNERAGTSVVLS
jgi:hypothetical protein